MVKQEYFDTDYSGRPLTNRTFTDEQRREDAKNDRENLLRVMDRIVILEDGTEAFEGWDGMVFPADPVTGLPDIDNPVPYPGPSPDNQ